MSTTTSQKRIDANRRNAKKSTGPRTVDGKARSRYNRLTHGLRSGEVVLASEDQAEFDTYLAGWIDEWKPPTETRRDLVARAVTAAWRLKRCVRIESDRLSKRIIEASAAWNSSETVAAAQAVQGLATRPVESIARREQTRLGVKRLSDLWRDLLGALDAPDGWRDEETHHTRFLSLLGVVAGTEEADTLAGHAATASRLLLGSRLGPAKSNARIVATRSVLRAICAAALTRLTSLWESRPDPAPIRARFAERTAFEFRPEDVSLQRYEASLDRELRTAIAQLITLTRTGADLAEPDPADALAPTEPNHPANAADLDLEAPTEPIDLIPVDRLEAPTDPNDLISVDRLEAPTEPNTVSPVAEADREIDPDAPTEPNGLDPATDLVTPTEPNEPESSTEFGPGAPTEANTVSRILPVARAEFDRGGCDWLIAELPSVWVGMETSMSYQ